jgi:hypothetical protein
MVNMRKIFKKFTLNMSDADFLNLINQLDSLDNGFLPEDDDDLLSDFYNNLYKICYNQIDKNLINNNYLNNRGQTIGEFMNFLKHI